MCPASGVEVVAWHVEHEKLLNWLSDSRESWNSSSPKSAAEVGPPQPTASSPAVSNSPLHGCLRRRVTESGKMPTWTVFTTFLSARSTTWNVPGPTWSPSQTTSAYRSSGVSDT